MILISLSSMQKKIMKRIFLILTFFMCALGFARDPVPSNRYELLSGVRKQKDEKSLWDQKYSNSSYVFGKTPAKFLAANYHYIAAGAHVLDMGMGEGRNAVFLAQKGYKVTGIDISSVAVRKARALSRELGVRIDTVVASMLDYKIPDATYDAIICFYYVERALHDKMLKWLKPGGVLIYEAHTDNETKVKGQEHYSKKYLLRPGELLNLFPGLKVLKYEEPLHVHDYTASIILQKIKK